MRTYAIIEGNTIINKIAVEGDWPEGEDVTDLDPQPGIGWTRTNESAPFLPPTPSEGTPNKKTLPKAMVIFRMTYNEFHIWKRAAGRADATNSPTVADKKAQQTWYWFETANDPLDLDAPEVANIKEAWGLLLIPATRITAILETV